MAKKIKTTPVTEPAPETKAPKAEPKAPAIPIAEMVAAMLPIVSKLGAVEAEVEGAFKQIGTLKAELCIVGQDFAAQGAARSEVKEAYQSAVAQWYGLAESKVKDTPKNGGDPHAYSLISELMTVTFPKDETNLKKARKGLEEGRSWVEIKSLARTGLLKAKNKLARQPEPLTLQKANEEFNVLMLKVEAAGIDLQEFVDSCQTSYEAHLAEKAGTGVADTDTTVAGEE